MCDLCRRRRTKPDYVKLDGSFAAVLVEEECQLDSVDQVNNWMDRPHQEMSVCDRRFLSSSVHQLEVRYEGIRRD